MAIFVDDNDYRSLVGSLERALTLIESDAFARALANVKPCAVTGAITKDQIIEALGENADVWPAAIRDDVQSEGESESANVIQFPGRR